MATSADIAKMFQNEVSDKKRTGRGIHKQKGKRGYVGRMLTTMDYLKGPELKKYKKAGMLKVSNVYDKVIPISELRSYAEETQRQIVEAWRQKFTMKQLAEGLGVSTQTYYKLCYKLGVMETPPSLGGKESMINKLEYEEIRDGDIVDYNVFKKLPKEEQFALIDEWQEKYSTQSIADYWRMNISAVYNRKHYLKKYMEKNNLMNDYIDNKNNNRPTILRKPVQDDLKFNDSENIKSDNLLDLAASLAKENEAVGEIEMETVEALSELNTDSKLVNRDKSITAAADVEKEDLENKFKLLQEQVAKLILEKEEEKAKDNELQNEVNRDAPVVSDNRNTNSMEFNLNDEKEGFELFTDISRFINVLRKNPDTFQVDIKIRKVDEV